MFIRKKVTPNKNTVVQIVENFRQKKTTIQRVLRHVGTAKSEAELESLLALAHTLKTQMEYALLAKPSDNTPHQYATPLGAWHPTSDTDKIYLHHLEELARTILGIHDIYGAVYETIGFNNLFTRPHQRARAATLLRDIVLARIARPSSKREAVHFLETQMGVTLKLEQVYQTMDKIDDVFIERLQRAALATTLKLTGDTLRVMFYDTTTLYFESFTEDELKQNGYSKDMKFNQAQVLLALFVTEKGLPVGYELFPGAMFEGHTLITALEKLKSRYQLNDVIFVADRGLLSKDNLKLLEEKKFKYVVGARLKNFTKPLTETILNESHYQYTNEKREERNAIFDYGKQRKLIVNYSVHRAKKDRYDREKAILKLKKKLIKSTNPTSLINNYGYKKYLKMEGESTVSLHIEKMNAEARWDGLMGVVTNMPDAQAENVLAHYHGFWQIEECFRINKHDLKMRPIYHWTPHRVKAHIAIAFMAFVCVKYLEYRLMVQSKKYSPEIIRQALLQVQASTLYDHKSNKKFIVPSKVEPIAKEIYRVMGIKLPQSPILL